MIGQRNPALYLSLSSKTKTKGNSSGNVQNLFDHPKEQLGEEYMKDIIINS